MLLHLPLGHLELRHLSRELCLSLDRQEMNTTLLCQRRRELLLQRAELPAQSNCFIRWRLEQYAAVHLRRREVHELRAQYRLEPIKGRLCKACCC